MDFAVTTIEHLYSTMVGRPGQPDPLLLLGAGASLKSGIPLSVGLVERAAKWAYCRRHGRDPLDPTVVRSDWWPWLESHPWYRREVSPADNYSTVIEHLLLPREERKEFFLQILRPGIPPSPGYERLLDFMSRGAFRTVLTTNFDSVLADLSDTRSRPHHLVLVKTPSDYTTISTVPPHPQLIYLHGSVDHYSDLNLLDEVQHMDDDLVRSLTPLLRDHPLIVVGYRGAEPSIMRHLLMEQADVAAYFRHGIFWCVRDDGPFDRLHPLVHELRDVISTNLQLVPIEGFDELLERLWALYEEQPARIDRSIQAPGLEGTAKPALTYDLEPVHNVALEDLDWTRVRMHLVDYCRRMGIHVPTPVERAWLIDRLIQSDLAISKGDGIVLTTAGWLLFGRHPRDQVRGAQVLVRLGGEPQRAFDGNLWSQLEGVMDALEEINQPFRLKDGVSDIVYPYSPLALKELVVNALVHRSYEVAQRVVVEVEPTHIRIVNPGGLVEDVLKRLGLPMQEQIERGVRGIRGYRNPVIADLYYGAGAMDKAGSGLADVQSWVRESGGKVEFGPTADNAAFDVIIYRRPEVPDETTGTAAALETRTHYVSNLLEVIEMPSVVWHGGTVVRRVGDVWKATGADELPGFILHESRLYTFSDLTERDNPLYSQVDQGNVEELSTDEFASGSDGERLFVYLLNECLYRHIESAGLLVDKKKKRASYPRTDAGPREITYQARLRRATRTVTKPIISKSTGKVSYWEHQAIRFGFERFGDTWALRLVPTYIFTLNGERWLLKGKRVTSLSTRRAARDYNPNVHNDLVFWAWVLANGQDTITIDAGSGSWIGLRGRLADFEVRDTPTPPDIVEPESDLQARYDADAIEEELAALAEMELAAESGDDDVSED